MKIRLSFKHLLQKWPITANRQGCYPEQSKHIPSEQKPDSAVCRAERHNAIPWGRYWPREKTSTSRELQNEARAARTRPTPHRSVPLPDTMIIFHRRPLSVCYGDLAFITTALSRCQRQQLFDRQTTKRGSFTLTLESISITHFRVVAGQTAKTVGRLAVNVVKLSPC